MTGIEAMHFLLSFSIEKIGKGIPLISTFKAPSDHRLFDHSIMDEMDEMEKKELKV
jgi:hypothetical protein